jgi:hypothetical protein
MSGGIGQLVRDTVFSLERRSSRGILADVDARKMHPQEASVVRYARPPKFIRR